MYFNGTDYYFFSGVKSVFRNMLHDNDIDNKDIPQGYVFPVMTGYSFDMTVEQHVSGFTTGDEKAANAGDFHDNLVHTLALERFAGKGPYDGQGTEVCYGQFYTESLSFKADNKKVVTSTLKFQGTGELHVGNYTSGASTLSDNSEV